MELTIHDMLSDNNVYFCRSKNDISSSSPEIMMRCFDIFKYESGWLFYRLHDNSGDLGYMDMDECLIGPCSDYDHMVCVGKILDKNGNKLDIIESPTWVEQEDYNKHNNNGTLNELITELSKVKYDIDDSGDHNELDHIDQSMDNEDDAEEDAEEDLSSCGNNCTYPDGEIDDNFTLGHSSSVSE